MDTWAWYDIDSCFYSFFYSAHQVCSQGWLCGIEEDGSQLAGEKLQIGAGQQTVLLHLLGRLEMIAGSHSIIRFYILARQGLFFKTKQSEGICYNYPSSTNTHT